MKRILVIKLSSLGDIAHALPAVRALKERTGAEIDWVVQEMVTRKDVRTDLALQLLAERRG